MLPADTARSAILGAPLNPGKQPSPSGVVAAFEQMQLLVLAQSTGIMIKATLSALNAVASAAAGIGAWVVDDPTTANNGVYENTGTSGSPAWTRRGDLPYGMIKALNVGAGTANAIVATSAIPVPSADGAALIILPIVATNDASPVTVAFNGDTALTVKSNTGNDIAIGGLQEDMLVVGMKQGSTFRLISDQVSAAIIAQAEALLAEMQELYLGAYSSDAEATAAAGGSPVAGQTYWNTSVPVWKVYHSGSWTATQGVNNWTVDYFAGDGTTTDFVLTGDPGSINNCFVTIDNVPTPVLDEDGNVRLSLSGTTLSVATAPPGDGVEKNIVVRYGSSITVSVGTPTAGSVGEDELNPAEAAGMRTVLDVYSTSEVDVLATPPRGHIFGLTLSNNTTDATNDIDIAAGEAASDATSPLTMRLAAGLTKRLDAAWAVGDGNGGLDTGAIADTTYHVWLIQRSDTGVVDVLFSASATSPTMPTDYDRKRRIGSIIRASGAILPFVQSGDDFTLVSNVTDRSSTSALSDSLVTLTVPTGIRVQPKTTHIYASTAATVNSSVSMGNGDAAAANKRVSGLVGSGTDAQIASNAAVVGGIFTNTSAQVRMAVSLSTGTLTSGLLWTWGWIDDRGRNA